MRPYLKRKVEPTVSLLRCWSCSMARQLFLRSRIWLSILFLFHVFLSLDALAQQPATVGDPDVDRYASNLSSFYADDKVWDAERARILKNIATVGQLRGTGRPNAKALADELDAISDLRSRAAKMALYGQIASDLDTSSETAQAKGAVGRQLEAQVEA